MVSDSQYKDKNVDMRQRIAYNFACSLVGACESRGTHKEAYMETERIKMGLVGCGGMSGAHMGGYRELWSKGIRDYEIVAACDIAVERAEERANQAHEFQDGTKPAVYTELDDMLAKHPDLECVDICALHSAHHTLAVPALDAGKHVIIEKPFGITMRACKLMMDAADRNDKNYLRR